MQQRNVFDRRVIFDHLPKTAGQAVNSWLSRTLGRGCVTPNLIGMHRKLIRLYGGEYSIISGHIIFNGEGLDPRYRYMTCFREPMDRAVSWLYFVAGNPEAPEYVAAKRVLASDGGDLPPEFASSICNPYVEHFSRVFDTASSNDEEKLSRALAAIELYDVWGFYEDLPEFLAKVAALVELPAPAQIERINVTTSRLGVKQISPLLHKRLKGLNELDLAFYSRLRERWQKERSHKLTILPKVSPWEPYAPVQDRVFTAPEFMLLSVGLEGGDNISRGQILRFELEFSLSEAVGDLEIGIHIFDEDSRWAFGTNTTLLERPLLQVARGTHRLGYYLMADLPEGQYTAGFAFTERRAEENRELAWFDKLVTFRVIVPRLTPGMGYVNLPVEFNCRQTSDAVVSLVEKAEGTLEIDAVLGDVVVGESFDLPVRLGNSSTQTWVSTGFNPINLSYHWLDLVNNPVVVEEERTLLPVRELLPGQTIATQMRVVAPSTSGRYRLVLVPVQEMNGWFDDKGFTPGQMELAVVARDAARRYSGADIRLFSQAGQRDGSALESTGQEGFLLFGPYAQLPAGRYVARLSGRCESGGLGVWVEVARNAGENILARLDLPEGASLGQIAELPFELVDPVSDLEVRMWVTAEAYVRIEALDIELDETEATPPVPVEADDVASDRQPEKKDPLGGRGGEKLRKKNKRKR